MLEEKDVIIPYFAIGILFVNFIVKNVTVLQNFYEGTALVFFGLQKDFRHVLGIGIHGAGKECGTGAKTNFGGEEGIIDGTHRCGFCNSPDFGGGRVLAFGQAIDLIVKENDVDIDVAADGMDEMIATDREPVPVSCDDPYGEAGIVAF